eukprot:1369573-Amorphochlora_amoeboformis.AAC.4
MQVNPHPVLYTLFEFPSFEPGSRSGRAHHPKCKTASSRTRSSAIGSTAEVVGAMASTVALHELGHFLAAYLQVTTCAIGREVWAQRSR